MSARGYESQYLEEGAAGGPATARLGTTLGGRWTLDSLLGVGGSSAVYAAHHRNGRRAAVKVLHRVHAKRPRLRLRFLAEGYAANRVGHSGAVAVLDDGEEPDGTVFLVMEYLTGASLASRLEGGPLSEHDTIIAAIGILDVLAAAHDRGILHRDVKPSNVFMTDDGAIKLLDFGSARVGGQDALTTQSDAILGTPAFMPPELAAGKTDELDARSDLWAVGATMFQLLTSETVHTARTSNEALIAAATRPARSIGAARPETSSELAAIVDRALSFEQCERWPNARSMQAALSALIPGRAAAVHSGLATIPEYSTPERYVPRRIGMLRAAIVVGTLVLMLPLARRLSHVVRTPTPAAQAKAIVTVDSPVEPTPPSLPAASVPPTPTTVEPSVQSRTPSRPRSRSMPVPETVPSTRRAGPLPEPSWQVDDVLDRRK